MKFSFPQGLGMTDRPMCLTWECLVNDVRINTLYKPLQQCENLDHLSSCADASLQNEALQSSLVPDFHIHCEISTHDSYDRPNG